LAGVRARGASSKNWDPYLFLQPLKLATSNLVFNLGLGSSLPRNNFYNENWQGARLGEHPKKFGTHYLFLQLLKLATSIWYTTWAWGVAYHETTFRYQNWQGSGLGEHPKKIWDLLFISATVEASNFKFGIQVGLGE